MSECSAAGPFHNWPLQRGFDRFYGFMQGETDQFYPELTRDNHHAEAPALPEDGWSTAMSWRKPRFRNCSACCRAPGWTSGAQIAPVNRDYRPPFEYAGTIRKVIFELARRPTDQDRREEAERQARAAIARQ